MATQQSQIYKQLRAQNNQGWMQGDDHRAVYAVEIIPAREVRKGDTIAEFGAEIGVNYGTFTHWQTVGEVQTQHLRAIEPTSGTRCVYVVRCRMTNDGRSMRVKEKPTNAPTKPRPTLPKF